MTARRQTQPAPRPRPAAGPAVPARHRARTPAPAPAQAPDLRPQVRRVALVLAATMVLWMFLSWAGGFYGWPARWAFLIDFLALVAFGWALLETYRLWRARRAGGGPT